MNGKTLTPEQCSKLSLYILMTTTPREGEAEAGSGSGAGFAITSASEN